MTAILEPVGHTYPADSAEWNRRSPFLWFLSIYLVLSPFYVVRSGLPQPADVILAFGCVIQVSRSSLKLPLPSRRMLAAGSLFL